MSRRVLFIGLDSVPEKLLFNELVEHLPNISNLLRKSIYGRLKSCDPPITVPAWTVMMSSKDPGILGIYGFRHRQSGSYNDPWIVNSATVKEKRVWDILQQYGKRSVVIGLPPAFPPFELHGKLVSCFLTPTGAKEYTYPLELKKEIESLVDIYKFDVVFRTLDRRTILDDIYEMTKKRFRVVQKLCRSDDWDFFIFVEIGPDRLHHAFWKYYDKNHNKYVAGNEYEYVVPEYYRYLDKEIGNLLSIVKDSIVIIASDHGTKAMSGAFCINEWLIKEGLLVLNHYPKNVIDIQNADINWEKTTAWGWGGYYARIFLNVCGREPAGRIDNDQYDAVREMIVRRMMSIKKPSGERMDVCVFKPEEVYKITNGDKPDLMVYFDNLSWRSAGTIGHNTMYLSENDTGPDDSVHSHDGMFIWYDPRSDMHARRVDLSIYDIAPTILDSLGVPVPRDMIGKSMTTICGDI